MGYATPSAWIIEGEGPEIHTAQKTARKFEDLYVVVFWMEWGDEWEKKT
jgi:hypothetical protein